MRFSICVIVLSCFSFQQQARRRRQPSPKRGSNALAAIPTPRPALWSNGNQAHTPKRESIVTPVIRRQPMILPPSTITA